MKGYKPVVRKHQGNSCGCPDASHLSKPITETGDNEVYVAPQTLLALTSQPARSRAGTQH